MLAHAAKSSLILQSFWRLGYELQLVCIAAVEGQKHVVYVEGPAHRITEWMALATSDWRTNSNIWDPLKRSAVYLRASVRHYVCEYVA